MSLLRLVVVLLLLLVCSVSAYHGRYHDDGDRQETREARHEHRKHVREVRQTEVHQQILAAQQFIAYPVKTMETPAFPACTTVSNCYSNCEAAPGFNSFIVNKCQETVSVQVISANYSSSFWATIPGVSAGNFSNLFFFNTASSGDYRILGPEIRSSNPQTCVMASGNQLINYCQETLNVQYFYTCNSYCENPKPAAMAWITVPGFSLGTRGNIVLLPYASDYCVTDQSGCYPNALLMVGGHTTQ
jgi:hypothetical protein